MAKLEAPAIADSDVAMARQFLKDHYEMYLTQRTAELMAAYLNWYLLSVEAKRT